MILSAEVSEAPVPKAAARMQRLKRTDQEGLASNYAPKRRRAGEKQDTKAAAPEEPQAKNGRDMTYAEWAQAAQAKFRFEEVGDGRTYSTI